MGKPRRTFTGEFKVEAVKLVTEQRRSFAEVATNLGIAESLLPKWKQNLDAEGNQAIRVHRSVLQPCAATFGLGLPVSGRV